MGSLEQHGLRYRMQDIFDFYEPIWQVKDLSASQHQELDRFLVLGRAELAVERPGDEWFTPPRVYATVLGTYGLLCDHPEEYQVPWPEDRPAGAPDSRARECQACQGIIQLPPIPEKPYVIAVLVDGPRQGSRVRVPVGQRWLSFPIPVEPWFGPLPEVAIPTPTVHTVDYRPTGRVHEIDSRFQEWAVS